MDLTKLHEDLTTEPPNTEYLNQILTLFVEGLCKFVPNKPEIHKFIQDDLSLDLLSIESMPEIIDRLIHWLEQFQAPVHDIVTKKWRHDFTYCTNYTDFIIEFVDEYKSHSELCYQEVWEARKKVANQKSAVPPEHQAKGKNGVPDNMKSGLK